MSKFKLKAKLLPKGDQPAAIGKLAANLRSGVKNQTLLGVTGSGKTFTVANVIERVPKPTLVISHNKTLAAQLYQEFKEFFPENAVHYFVSYYDYYQPEAYIPTTDTYIEKDAKINETIDALRHASTTSLLTRKDVIIVASVSCIYGLGSPEEYEKVSIGLCKGQTISQKVLTGQLVLLQYTRNPIDPKQGNFRARENTVEIHLPTAEETVLVHFEKNKIASIEKKQERGKGEYTEKLTSVKIFPAKHFVAPKDRLGLAMQNIRRELKDRLQTLKKDDRVLEHARLKQRTEFDLEMLENTGYVNGIENYSRHLDFREEGKAPFTLVDYFHYAHGNDFLTIIDESHATVPQLRGMYHGDRARKETLIKYGFRLPSAKDNRPLKFEEFNQKISQTIYVSATPAPYELEVSKKSCPLSDRQPAASCIVKQLIRPTGVLDPEIRMRRTKGQVQDVIKEIKKRSIRGERSLVLALTKRLAEDIAEYLAEAGIKARYLHSEVKTLERPEVLKKLRLGEYDAIVGINLLREGLDLPEVSFIAILDADKEGFLRNKTTLLQIIGRAARHTKGEVILYADTKTESMRLAIEETEWRRKIQKRYNQTHKISPTQIRKEVRETILGKSEAEDITLGGFKGDIVSALRREMKKAAREMDFEKAAKIRDRIKSSEALPREARPRKNARP